MDDFLNGNSVREGRSILFMPLKAYQTYWKKQPPKKVESDRQTHLEVGERDFLLFIISLSLLFYVFWQYVWLKTIFKNKLKDFLVPFDAVVGTYWHHL